MKKLIFFVLLLSICLPGCKKNKVKLKPSNKMVVKTVGSKPASKTLAEEAQEFPLEDDTSFNVFDDETKKLEEQSDLQDNENAIELENIQFEFDKTDIRPSEKPKIVRNTQVIKNELSKKGDSTVKVKGHSCLIAKNESYNHMISYDRAVNTAKEYEQKGVPANKIKTVGFGATKTLTNEPDMKLQSINRRAETIID